MRASVSAGVNRQRGPERLGGLVVVELLQEGDADVVRPVRGLAIDGRRAAATAGSAESTAARPAPATVSPMDEPRSSPRLGRERRPSSTTPAALREP